MENVVEVFNIFIFIYSSIKSYRSILLYRELANADLIQTQPIYFSFIYILYIVTYVR